MYQEGPALSRPVALLTALCPSMIVFPGTRCIVSYGFLWSGCGQASVWQRSGCGVAVAWLWFDGTLCGWFFGLSWPWAGVVETLFWCYHGCAMDVLWFRCVGIVLQSYCRGVDVVSSGVALVLVWF